MLKKLSHIHISLILSILFLFLVLFVEYIRNNVFYSIIVLLVVLLGVYWKTNEMYTKYDLYLIVIILISLIASRLIFREVDQATLTLRVAAITAFVLLNIVLLIGPWSRFSDKIARLYHYRRHFGIVVFLLGALHASIILPLYFNFSFRNAFASPFTFYGLTAFYIMFWMAISSWDYLQKTIKSLWWNIIHAVMMLGYLAISLYFYTVLKSLNDSSINGHVIAIVIFLLFWIIVAPYSIIRKIMNTYVFGWKQVHVLIYIVYFATVLHVSLGILVTVGIVLKILFWISVILVIGSHTAGWIKKFLEDKKINSNMKTIHKLLPEKGKTFIRIAKVSDFEEGKGKKFYINKKPIAVFKNKGNFFAVSNVCCHQKGPIYKGKINYGTVECPWHYWVYNLKDGKFLGKEKLCLPVYETKVKDNVLYVNPEPVKK